MDRHRSSPQALYLLAGGPGNRRSGTDPLLSEIFAHTGTPAPTIAYIGAASDDNPEFFQWLETRFTASGAGRVTLAPTASPQARMVQTREIVEQSDLVCVSGGDVEAGMALLKRRDMIPFLRTLYRNGKPFFGLSAGSIMLARAWVRWANPHDDTTSEPFDCLNCAPLFCDMHAEADEWEELKALLRLQAPGTIGYGLPTGTALRFDPTGTLIALKGSIARFEHDGRKINPLPPLKPSRSLKTTTSSVA